MLYANLGLQFHCPVIKSGHSALSNKYTGTMLSLQEIKTFNRILSARKMYPDVDGAANHLKRPETFAKKSISHYK